MSETPEKDATTCERCGMHPGTVLVRRPGEGGSPGTRERLCPACAKDAGIEVGLAGEGQMIADPIVAMFKGMKETSGSGALCPGCGMTFSRFRETARLGCGTCYETFENELARLLRRIHGTTRHAGKHPRGDDGNTAVSRIKRLNDELERAVVDEDYERAAELRDRLRDLGAVAGVDRGDRDDS